jgi:FkbM family methyltransferase
MSNPSSFYAALLHEIMNDLPNYFGADNWDEVRSGVYRPSFWERMIVLGNRLLKGKITLSSPDLFSSNNLDAVTERLDGLSRLYDLVADDRSRDTLVKLMAYRILGYHKVKLPFAFTRDVDAIKQSFNSLKKSDDTIKIKFYDWTLHHFDFRPAGYPIECFQYHPAYFLVEPYAYNWRQPPIAIQPGDVIIDGGACWGDTALYFAYKTGERGKVFSFEFVPENIEVFQRNLSLNPHLSPTIEIVNNALSDVSQNQMYFSYKGPGTRLTDNDQNTTPVFTVSIDDFVEQHALDRVDFIKMDIEGSELSALRGAEKTLRKFKPKLAICLYHRLDDFITIPEYLNQLGLSYVFYIDHTTIHTEETVLFAEAGAGGK